jgi:hypothetical protein
MIHLRYKKIVSIEQAYEMLQTAINLEFATLPPYLYAAFSIREETNAAAMARLRAITHEEMIHLCLGANILNALGGQPRLVPPKFPGPLPGDIGVDGQALIVHMLPFGKAAMQQSMSIETPVDPLQFRMLALAEAPETDVVTIGEFYGHLDTFLKSLPASAWHPGRNQIADDQFFAGSLFAVENYADAHRAIDIIVSEGEGSRLSPLDFSNELAHYYRFEEIYRNQLLVSSNVPEGYGWGEPLGVDWSLVHPAIADPQTHDFSRDPEAAQQAQQACTRAYSAMVDALNQAFDGASAQLGIAVRAMFALRTAALAALHTPLADPAQVAGPAFLYQTVLEMS